MLLLLALLLLALYVRTAAAQAGAGDSVAGGSTAVAPSESPDSGEKKTPWFLISVIVLPSMFVLWLIVCGFLAYVFIKVCPDRHTK